VLGADPPPSRVVRSMAVLVARRPWCKAGGDNLHARTRKVSPTNVEPTLRLCARREFTRQIIAGY
jgi:hypothetical protein